MTKWDKFIIIFVILTSLSFVVFFALDDSYANKVALVRVDGEIVERLSLTDENEGKTFPIETRYGRNVILVENNSVRVIEASCPDLLDVKQGAISKNGQTIVCLPNHLVIEVVEESETELDGISR